MTVITNESKNSSDDLSGIIQRLMGNVDRKTGMYFTEAARLISLGMGTSSFRQWVQLLDRNERHKIVSHLVFEELDKRRWDDNDDFEGNPTY